MNQHFTATSKKLAQEKAEADAALADLKRRRAQTSEFVPSKSGELNPFDTLYVELQQKRADCRRKERETMLLYQRYAHKFQKNKTPATTFKALQKKKATPPSLQEVDEAKYDEETDSVRTPRKGQRDDNDESSTPEAAAPPPSPPPPIQNISDMSPTQFNDLDSAPETLPPAEEVKDVPDLPDLKSKSLPATVPEEKVLEQEQPQEEESKQEETQQEEDPQKSITPAVETTIVIDCDESTQEPQSTTEAGEPAAVDKPEEEEETAATPVLNSLSSESFSVNRPTVEVTATTQSEDDSDEEDQRSIISGLTTVNSALTRQVMEQLESEMECFIKNETEAIQKLLDEEEEVGASAAVSFGGSHISSDASVACDQSVQASIMAEQMADRMERILERFEKDELSAADAPKSPGDGKQKTSSITHSLYPRKYKSPNPNEEWMVHWDEKFEREYYYEAKTNTTQWEAPVMKLGFKDNPNFTPKAMPKRTQRLVIEKRMSRSDVYRKKLRKRRMQRAAFLFVILGTLSLSAVHWQMNHAERSYPDAMEATYTTVKDAYEYHFTNRTAAEQEAADIARREREQKAREAAELERKRKVAEAAEAKRLTIEQIKTQKEAERKRKAAEEAEKKRKLTAEKKVAEEKAYRETRLKEEEEARQSRLEEERKVEEARMEAERLAHYQEELRRPWGCNLPFSYVVHGRCRRLTKLNPMYSEEHLLNSFLQ